MKQLKESIRGVDPLKVAGHLKLLNIPGLMWIGRMPWLKHYNGGAVIEDYVRETFIAGVWGKVVDLGQEIKAAAGEIGLELSGTTDDPAGCLQTIIWISDNQKLKSVAKKPEPLEDWGKEYVIVLDTLQTLCQDKTIYNIFDSHSGKRGWETPLNISYMDNRHFEFGAVKIANVVGGSNGLSAKESKDFIKAIESQVKKCKYIKEVQVMDHPYLDGSEIYLMLK